MEIGILGKIKVFLLLKDFELEFILSPDFSREISTSPGSTFKYKGLNLPEGVLILDSVLIRGEIEAYQSIWGCRIRWA